MNIYLMEKVFEMKKREVEQYAKEKGRPKQIKSNIFSRSHYIKRKTTQLNQAWCA
ncbi:hypothetical protein [Fictibacillus phosphorivorans]|uniref:hypothetical protein n=1 Tax=Fictibacillus phosphorivorans TaxID=1221500 RepID=UPI000B23320D|nr:hypothetical protein [Fictibacillus phosphorivorans]